MARSGYKPSSKLGIAQVGIFVLHVNRKALSPFKHVLDANAHKGAWTISPNEDKNRRASNQRFWGGVGQTLTYYTCTHPEALYDFWFKDADTWQTLTYGWFRTYRRITRRMMPR